MPRLMLAGLAALALTACAGSPKIALPSIPKIPEPPRAALTPCRPATLTIQGDGSMTSADAERAIRLGDIVLAECEARRRLLAEAWPKAS